MLHLQPTAESSLVTNQSFIITANSWSPPISPSRASNSGSFTGTIDVVAPHRHSRRQSFRLTEQITSERHPRVFFCLRLVTFSPDFTWRYYHSLSSCRLRSPLCRRKSSCILNTIIRGGGSDLNPKASLIYKLSW